EERQHVEAVEIALERDEARARARGGFDVARDFGRVPRTAVDERLAVGAERRAVPEELPVRARRDDAAVRAEDDDGAIAREAVRAECRPFEPLAGHGL